jgi:hypothetical protein
MKIARLLSFTLPLAGRVARLSAAKMGGVGVGVVVHNNIYPHPARSARHPPRKGGMNKAICG